MTADLEYLLALAEEEHIRREAVHRTRLRMSRMERIAEIRASLLAEIRRLMWAPFSWQTRL